MPWTLSQHQVQHRSEMSSVVQAKAKAATQGNNLVDVENERAKEVLPKAGSIELLGHEDPGASAAAGELTVLMSEEPAVAVLPVRTRP